MPDRWLKSHASAGSAGGAAKCAFLKHIGVDHVIDYRLQASDEALLRGSDGYRCHFEISAAST
jgi:NADPH-dependent curcumin reductase CurA